MSNPEFFLGYCTDGQCRQIPVQSRATAGIEISASVGNEAHNRFEDVRTIQDAINQVPVNAGGPQVKLNVDGIVGPKTLRAIRKFQDEACGFKWPDGRIDPNRRTHYKLGEFFLEPNPYHLMLVYAVLPNVVRWMRAAQRALQSAELAINGGFTANERGLSLLRKYFHIDALLNDSQKRATIRQINSLYMTAITCVGHHSPMTEIGTGYFQEDLKGNLASAYTTHGGYQLRRGSRLRELGYKENFPNVRGDAIYICPRVLKNRCQEFYTMLVSHELAHFCGPAAGPDIIADHGYRRNDGLAKEGRGLASLSAYQALRTADCYAHFAGEAAEGREVINS